MGSERSPSASPTTAPGVRARRNAPEQKESTGGALWPGVAMRGETDPGAELLGVRGEGAPLAPPQRSRMERAFGRDLGHVRLHTGSEGAAASRGAAAMAAGSHVALSPSAPRPGTLAGDAILAHELAHTVQQAGAVSPSAPGAAGAEREADRAATAVLLGTQMPALRPSGLQLRACSPSQADKQKAADLLTDPAANRADLIAMIDKGGSDVAEALKDYQLVQPKFRDALRHWAQMPGGSEILLYLSDALAKASGTDAIVMLSNIKPVVDERRAADLTYTASEQAELARIEAAIAADTRKADYTDPKKTTPPLKFPVKLYQPGKEDAGQVYYDPKMPRGHSGEAGITAKDAGAHFTFEGKKYEFRWQPFIRLGPLALSSDENIRSTMFHEWMHYWFWSEQGKGTSGDAVARDLAATPDTPATGGVTARGANEDLEIVGLQLRDAGKLSVDEVASLFGYAALQLKSTAVKTDFKQRFEDRVEATATNDAAVRQKLLDALKSSVLKKDDLAALDPVKTKITAAKPPKAKTAPKAPAKKGP